MSEPSPSLHPENFTSIEGAAPDWFAAVAPALGALQTGLAKVESARPDILNDVTKTEAARLVALDQLWKRNVEPAQELAKAALDALVVVKANLALEKDKLFAAPQDAAGAMVASEIRQALARLDAKERRAVIDRAVEAGDHTLMKAIGSAPGFLIGVADEVVEGHRAAFIQRHCPDIAAKEEACRLMVARAQQTKNALAQLRSRAFDVTQERLISEAVASSDRAQRHLN